MCVVLLLCLTPVLFLVAKYAVTVFSSSDRPCVDDVTYEDASVAYFTSLSSVDNHLDGRRHKLVAAYNADGYALNHIGRILNAAVYSGLPALSDSVHVVVFKPIDVRAEQSFFYLFKFRLSNDCFNLFHALNNKKIGERPDFVVSHCNVSAAKVLQKDKI